MITLKKQHRHYDKVKKTSVEWFKEIPNDWSYEQLKRCLKNNDGGTWGEDFDEEGTIVLRSTEIDINGRWSIVDPVKRNLTEKEKSGSKLYENDLLLTKSSGSASHLGKTALVTKAVEDLDCAYSNFMQRLRVNNKLHAKYLHYFLNNDIGRNQINYWGQTSSGLVNLDRKTINLFVVPLPSVKGQSSIASYLDEKCALIDSIIAKKQRQIELLEEQRAAIINCAVTKGLDEKVEMKESDFGKIPRHWKVLRIRYVSELVKTGTTPDTKIESYFEGDENWFTPSDFSSFELSKASRKISKKAITENECRLFPSHCALMVSIGATLGKVGISEQDFSCNQQINVIVPAGNMNYRFIAYFLLTMNNLVRSFSLETTLAILNQDRLKQIPILVPPKSEQEQIVHAIEMQISKIDDLMKKIDQAISLLAEYKTSLISHAVTGKIKVST